jgi:hypothetical protein
VTSPPKVLGLDAKRMLKEIVETLPEPGKIQELAGVQVRSSNSYYR